MSTYYYLVCEKHKKAVFITNNKGDAPDRSEFLDFMYEHIYKECKIEFVDEHRLAERETASGKYIDYANPD